MYGFIHLEPETMPRAGEWIIVLFENDFTVNSHGRLRRIDMVNDINECLALDEKVTHWKYAFLDDVIDLRPSRMDRSLEYESRNHYNYRDTLLRVGGTYFPYCGDKLVRVIAQVGDVVECSDGIFRYNRYADVGYPIGTVRQTTPKNALIAKELTYEMYYQLADEFLSNWAVSEHNGEDWLPKDFESLVHPKIAAADAINYHWHAVSPDHENEHYIRR